MAIIGNTVIERFRDYRSKTFPKVGNFLLKLHISANMMTFFSLLFGILSVYYFFQNHLYFIIFVVLHLLADALDGMIARAATPTEKGIYFDYLVDNSIVLLLLLAAAWYLQDYFIFIIAILFIFSNLTYLISRRQAPLLQARTVFLIVLFFKLYLLAALVIGVVSAYSLARQLQWFVVRI